MAFEPFMQIFRGLQGRKTREDGLGRIQNMQQVAYLRNLKRESMKDEMHQQLSKIKLVIFDIETTGFSPEQGDVILSIGAVKMHGEDILTETFYSLVQTDRDIPFTIQALTGITEQDVKEAPPITEVLHSFFRYSEGYTFVAHHSAHERIFMQNVCSKYLKTSFKQRIVDTAFLVKAVEPTNPYARLEELCEQAGIEVEGRHHALEDAKMTALLWQHYVRRAQQIGCETLHDVYTRFSNAH